MDKKIKLIIGAIVLFGAVLMYLGYVESTKPGIYDEFAKCLTEKNFIMAGTDWCHVCQQQKELFGNSFKHINYKNCDREKQWCNEHGVDSYPRWFDSEGKDYGGVQSLETLSTLSGCSRSEEQ